MNGKFSNDFNGSSVRPEALEGWTEGFSAESYLANGEEQFIAGWQIKRDGTLRGIIEIVEEST
jgi:hypothetical protein